MEQEEIHMWVIIMEVYGKQIKYNQSDQKVEHFQEIEVMQHLHLELIQK